MAKVWIQWNDKFAKLSAREKWLITLCGAVLIVMVVFVLLIEPTIKANEQLNRQVITSKANAQRLEGEVLLMTAKLKQDPNQAINQEFERLSIESQALSEELAKTIEGLLTPNQMAQMLEGVLASSKGLRLVSLQSLKAEPIMRKGNQGESGYYLHPVQIELTGDFFSIVTYLETLESMPSKYYWRRFHYSVESYPTARLMMEVYTLGTRQEFIGG
ncbi:type II secretion system protein M [Vibrio cholerae]